jgi:trimethylamine:corrinoid methyltransferase-like protein
MAINEIERVATEGKNYLMLKHTSINTRKELFVPKLADRDRRGAWQRNGSKDIIERAREKVNQILESQKGPGISNEVEKEFQEYYKKISSRTYEDYQKAEGMDKTEGIKLPGME